MDDTALLQGLPGQLPQRRMDSDLSRRRANTTQTVSYQMGNQTVPPPPDTRNLPENVSYSVTVAAINYATHHLKHRDITPRTRDFLERLARSAEDCLASPLSKEKKIVFVTLNGVLHSKAFLQKHRTPKDPILTDAILRLREYKYMADYGDYLATFCKNFRQDAKLAPVEGLEHFCGGKSWGMVEQTLEREERDEKIWERKGCPGGPDARPLRNTFYAIVDTCTCLGIDYDHVRFAIKSYAQRNSLAHAGIGQLIDNCDFTELGRRLTIDIADCSGVFGSHDTSGMLQIMESLRDRYFEDVNPTDGAEPILTDEAEWLRKKRIKRRKDALEKQKKEIE